MVYIFVGDRSGKVLYEGAEGRRILIYGKRCSGFQSHTRDTSFWIGLQGIHVSDVERVLSLIDEIVKRVSFYHFFRLVRSCI